MNLLNSEAFGKTVWAFDLGKASIGEAVRYGEKFLHKASLLIPLEFAETKAASGRRRMWRTRKAHKAREQWLDDVMRQAHIEVLNPRNYDSLGIWKPGEMADKRLEREFGDPGDKTCYTSCSLRIRLLRGEKLETWQIYKALRSAIQKRGYGRVPWARHELKRSGKDEEETERELARKDPEYKIAVEAWKKFKQEFTDSRFHFPCYFDAFNMGLWKPDALQERITCNAQSTRRVRFDREDVEREIAALGNQAVKQFPQIQEAFERIKANGWTQRDGENTSEKRFHVAAKDFGEFLVHGPAGEPPRDAKEDFGKYLAFRKQANIHPGSTDDWMGATSQKIPRFDNRIVNDCALLEGFQVCNVGIRYDSKKRQPYPESLLASEVTLLMKLKNTLVSGSLGQRKLTPKEIQTIFKVLSDDALSVPFDTKDWSRKVANCFALTKTAWGMKKGVKQLELRPLPGHEIIKSPKIEGRSRFSRPALRLIRAMVLSGQKPSEFRSRLVDREKALLDEIGLDVMDLEPARWSNGVKNFIKQPRPWILVKHLKFLEDLARTNDVWENIHIPEQKLDALGSRHTNESGHLNKSSAVGELLGSINNPVVRHRLGIFAQRLEELSQDYGVPSEIALEFIREDFMGELAKRDLQKFQSDREKSRKEAKIRAAELGSNERSAPLKYELYKAQGCVCLYCGQTFAATNLEDYEIEHVVPRSQGGPDAMVNFVLAHKDCNDKKGEQTPYQWKHGKEGWNGYENIVKQHAVTLRNKKVQLLLREDAQDLVQRYTALAETAWISKLAQIIISLHFGWRNGIDYSGKNPIKRVSVISGGLTGRIRRKYRINSILNPAPPGTTNPIEWEINAEKNRSDDRHHALDAMVISFLPTWMRDPRKEHFFRFPDSIHENAKGYFAQEIASVIPRPIARIKPPMEETLYGSRRILNDTYIVKRRPLSDLAVKEVKGKLELKPLKDVKPQKIIDGAIRRLVEEFLESHPNMTLSEWNDWCATVRLNKNGPLIKQALMTETEPNALGEYGNFIKPGDTARPQYRRAANHAGYFIVTKLAQNKSNPTLRKIEVRPVFAFQSFKTVEASLKAEPTVEIIDYFWSNCQVTLALPWSFKGENYPAGEYTLKTLWAQGNAVLKHSQLGLIGAKPKHNAPVGLRTLVEAGIRKAK